MYFKTLLKSQCCACTACENSCPVQAISFVTDEEGFLYPVIDKDRCIDCGLCERVCPVEHPVYDYAHQPLVYAAVVKAVEERKRSSSGGMFFAIASFILSKGGKVYGATIDDEHQVKHIGIDNVESLKLLRGSKYVQSDLQHVFIEIKNDLLSGRWCYFVGTGCQVAGLKAFLRKDYRNLLTSDLVCHGVPSQWLFDQHIQYLENKYKGKVLDYHFRDNENWGGCEIVNLQTREGHIKHIINPTYYLSPFLNSFMYGMTSRYTCYQCPFAKIPRQGDITLADFWGVRNYFPKIKSEHGVSLILINTEKGFEVLDKLKDICEFYESSVKDGAQFNGNLIQTTKEHKNRKIVYGKIKKYGYDTVAKNEFKSPRHNQIRLFVFIKNTPVLRHMWKALGFMLKKY